MKKGAHAVKVMVFAATSATEFTLEKVTAVKVFDYQILQEIKAKKAENGVKITKVDAGKLKKLMPDIVEGVMKQLGLEYEDSASESEEVIPIQ